MCKHMFLSVSDALDFLTRCFGPLSCQLLQSSRFVPSAEVLVDEVPAVPSYLSDRYKVGRMLGDGNFAVVRECVEHSTGREYALKIINKGKCRGKVTSGG